MDSDRLYFESIKKADENRNAFIEDLLARVHSLTEERNEIDKKKEMAEYTYSKYADDLRVARLEINELQRSMDYNAFVMVLIDGDGMPFLDELVQRGISGGEDTAQKLREALSSYVKDLDGMSLHDAQIVVRIYANMEGLSKTYRDAKLLPSPSQLDLFVRGFNKSHPLCDFSDAGNDKEAADSKIKETLKLYFRNVHCKHIVFGGSADNSYAGFLRSYTAPDTLCTRITLLEGPPFARSMEEIAPRFLQTSFRHIFRNNKILTRRVSFHDDRPGSTPESPVATSYAKTVVGLISGSNGIPDTPTIKPASSSVSSIARGEAPAPNKMFRNRIGQRIDSQLPFDGKIVGPMKARKLCNKYFLAGYCPYNNYCTHDHSAKLNAIELQTLRYIARSSPCSTILCADENCLAGHRCPQDPNCDRGRGCRWPAEMHNVDTRIVDQTKVI